MHDSGQHDAASAATQSAQNATNYKAIDDDFIEQASAKGMAEIETGKMALQRGTDAVKDFAQRMIEEHGKANENAGMGKNT